MTAFFHVDRAIAHHERSHTLAEPLVGAPDDDRLAYAGVELQQPFDLGRGDVLAGPDDHVLAPADDGQPSLLVQGSEIPGGEPSTPHGLIGLLRPAVPDEQLGPPEQDLASLPRPDGTSRAGLDHLDHRVAH